MRQEAEERLQYLEPEVEKLQKEQTETAKQVTELQQEVTKFKLENERLERIVDKKKGDGEDEEKAVERKRKKKESSSGSVKEHEDLVKGLRMLARKQRDDHAAATKQMVTDHQRAMAEMEARAGRAENNYQDMQKRVVELEVNRRATHLERRPGVPRSPFPFPGATCSELINRLTSPRSRCRRTGICLSPMPG